MNKIVKNYFYILSGNIIAKILTFIFFMIIARYYGKEVFGSYNFAISIISYFIMFSMMGIQSYAVLCISREPQNEYKMYREIVSCELLLAIISSILMMIYVILFPKNNMMILFVGTTIVIQALNTDWLFNAKQELTYTSYSMIINSLLQCILILLLIVFKNRNVYFLPIIVSISQLVSYIYLIICSKNKFNLKLKIVKCNIFPYIRNGIPFFFSGIFATVNCNIDIILLGFMKTNEDVGLYSAAYKIINMLVLFVSIIFSPIYPVLVELIAQNKTDKLNKLLSTVSKVILMSILPITVGGILLSGNLISLLFGKSYEGATQAFCILLLYTILLYFREIYGYTLSTSGSQKIYMYIVSVSSSINIMANYFLIPRFGINGAAFATLMSEVINLIFMGIMAHRKVEFHIRNVPFVRIILSSFIMGIMIYFINKTNINVLGTVVTGAIVYLILIYCLRVVKKEELNKILGDSK